MSVLFELARFLLFVAGYLACGYGLWRLNQRRLEPEYVFTTGKYFLEGTMEITISLALFILPLALLAGYFNIWLTLLLFIGLEVSAFITALLSLFIESGGPSRWLSRAMAVSGEFWGTHLWFSVPQVVLLLLTFIGYPIAAGLFYFSLTGDQLTLRIFQLQTVNLAIGYISWLLGQAALLQAPAADEETRAHVFVRMLSNMIPFGLFLAIALWAFQIASPGANELGQGLPILLSPLVVAILLSVFFFFAGLPYVLGVRRGKQFRIALYKKQKQHISHLVRPFQLPLSPSEPSLLRSEIEESSEELFDVFVEKTKEDIEVHDDLQFTNILSGAIKNSATLTTSDLPTDVIDRLQPIFAEDADPSDLDPEDNHLRWLSQFTKVVWQARDDLNYLEREKQGTETDPSELQTRKDEWRKQWLQTWKDQDKLIDEEITEEEGTKPYSFVVASGLISPVGAVFIDNIAGWVWDVFQSSVGG
jgi:hypothetical protein